MPELPEVEHFKKYFNRTSTGKKIANITCKDGKLLKGGTLKKINSELDGKSFKSATRRGKFLIAEVTGSPYKVVFHFGMTGYFHYKKKKDAPEKNLAKVIFEFSNGDELQWIDQRKFGRVYAVQDIDTIKTLKNMGPEALKISSSGWSALLKENVFEKY
jgi:formamidopyrimidine-DNA glycosylase